MTDADQWRFAPVDGWGEIPDGIELGDVAGVAVDADDNVYLFNRGTHPVVILDRDGAYRSSWGQGVFANAHGISVTPDGHLLLTDNGDHTVRKFTLDGQLLFEIGSPGVNSGFMSGEPFSLCTHAVASPDGSIFVTDGYGNARVHKYDAEGNHVMSWGSPGTLPGEFNLPHNLACDPDGWLYVADRENHRVQVFDTDGNYRSQINNIHRPSGLTIGPGTDPVVLVGELMSYAIGNRNNPNLGPRVSILTNDGTFLARIESRDGAGVLPGQFVSPHSLALDSRGDLYVGEVASTDWQVVFLGSERPPFIRRFQKFERTASR